MKPQVFISFALASDGHRGMMVAKHLMAQSTFPYARLIGIRQANKPHAVRREVDGIEAACLCG
jgi:hypothetical protein